MNGRAFQKGAGCGQCHDTGFRGRAAIYEMLEISGEIRRMVHRGAATHEFRSFMEKHEMRSLRQEGVHLALQGRTTLDEVFMSTGQDEEDGECRGRGAVSAEVVL
jgi:type II secretory ATPase GspE/PulE/Tfp pilus assembly ATPase PilB-like protein